MMRIIALIGIFLPSMVMSQPSVIYCSGTLDSSVTWNADTVIITSSILIPQGVTLSIDPGVTIQIAAGQKIMVYGHLKACGTSIEPIVFQAIDTTGFCDFPSLNSGWGGIRFYEDPAGNDSSIMDFCHIGHTWSSTDEPLPCGGVQMYARNRLRISNCTIHDNHVRDDGGGIVCLESSPLILNNEIRGNMSGRTGGGIYLAYCNAPLIHSNYIHNNFSTNKGGGIYCKSSKARIIHNRINSNECLQEIALGVFTGDGGGIYLQDDYAGAWIINNILIGNRSAGGVLHEASLNSEIMGNLICNNSPAGVLCGHSGSISRYINNTICNHDFAGVILNASSQTWINNIIWDNGYLGMITNIRFIADTPWMNYSALTGGYPGPGFGNIDTDPLFTSPCQFKGIHPLAWSADWGLQAGSPCIDQGSADTSGLRLTQRDLLGHIRVQGGRIDMGALESQSTNNLQRSLPLIGIGIFPNPGNDSPVIQLNKPGEALVLLSDITGRVVYRGNHKHLDQLYLARIKPGLYVYNIHLKNGAMISGKWIKEKSN